MWIVDEIVRIVRVTRSDVPYAATVAVGASFGVTMSWILARTGADGPWLPFWDLMAICSVAMVIVAFPIGRYGGQADPRIVAVMAVFGIISGIAVFLTYDELVNHIGHNLAPLVLPGPETVLGLPGILAGFGLGRESRRR